MRFLLAACDIFIVLAAAAHLYALSFHSKEMDEAMRELSQNPKVNPHG